jgi:hypothetical protein
MLSISDDFFFGRLVMGKIFLFGVDRLEFWRLLDGDFDIFLVIV